MATLSNELLVGIVGAGGFGQEVIHDLMAQLDATRASSDNKSACFVESEPAQRSVAGYPCLSFQEFVEHEAREKAFNVAIADPGTRRRVASELLGLGLLPWAIQGRTAHVLESASLGLGSILCDFTSVTANAQVGDFFHGNLYSYVAHDCRIGDFVTFAPNVMCLGNVHIEDDVYVGAGAIIRQGTPDVPRRIGKGSVIGMGAVVIRDVPPYTTVVGNPARVLRTSRPDDLNELRPDSGS